MSDEEITPTTTTTICFSLSITPVEQITFDTISLSLERTVLLLVRKNKNQKRNKKRKKNGTKEE